jgi:hemolysin activation/secretion protein
MSREAIPCKAIASAIGLFFLLPAHAASSDDQFIIQQQRQKALEQQLTPPTPDVRLSGPASGFGQIPSRRKHPALPSTAWR